MRHIVLIYAFILAGPVGADVLSLVNCYPADMPLPVPGMTEAGVVVGSVKDGLERANLVLATSMANLVGRGEATGIVLVRAVAPPVSDGFVSCVVVKGEEIVPPPRPKTAYTRGR